MASSQQDAAAGEQERATTKSELRPGVQLCRWCRRPIHQLGRGRPRAFCKRSCRQRDFEARSRAASHGLDEEQLIVTRASLNDLQDTIYVLQCAVNDFDRDYPLGAARADRAELLEALGWLMQAARPVVAHPSLQ